MPKNDIVDVDQLPNFDEILVNATDIEPRLKSLWIEIYQNARRDRERADAMLTNLLVALSSNSPDVHTLHGPQASRYLERIGRANEQLLKLAEQIRQYRVEVSELDSDELLDKIEQTDED